MFEEILEDIAQRNSLREVNTSLKLAVGLGGLVLCLVSTGYVAPLFIALALIGALVLLARIDAYTVAELFVAPAIFAATGVIVIVLTSGGADPFWIWQPLSWLSLSVTPESIDRGFLVFCRTLGGMASLIFIALTTPMTDLFGVMRQCRLPAVLVGHSWGAMLALLVAAASPRTVARLVLVGSGPLDPSSARGIMAARLGSLGPGDRAELIRLHESLGDLSAPPEPAVLERYGELVARADAVDPVYPVPQEFPPDPEIHRLVWSEAAALRASGYFVEQARLVACPIAVIHGENDPHPFEGVVEPLHAAGVSPRVHVLTACGHTPWIERRARERFFALLRQELVAPVRP